jgi:AcrR family transcriptional regulator
VPAEQCDDHHNHHDETDNGEHLYPPGGAPESGPQVCHDSSSASRSPILQYSLSRIKSERHDIVQLYPGGVPKLWNQTIEEHRRTVHAAIVDTTAALVAEHGLAAVTMSRIAQETGIGRATLYKYFPDVESIMVAWHDRRIADHLHQLADVGAGPGAADERLAAVLRAYATLSAGHATHELGALLHRGERLSHAREHLLDFVAGLISEAATAGRVRDDVPAREFAAFCVNAMAAANDMRDPGALDRLLATVLAALRPPAPRRSRRRVEHTFG